jgi:hypothetical protein
VIGLESVNLDEVVESMVRSGGDGIGHGVALAEQRGINEPGLYLKSVWRLAGIAAFLGGEWETARGYLEKGEVGAEVVIGLLGEGVDCDDIVCGGISKIENGRIDEGREMCIGNLMGFRYRLDTGGDQDVLRRIDDCLVKAYAEMSDSTGLFAFLNEMAPFYYDVDSIVSMLHARGAFYAQSLVHKHATGKIKEYLQLSLDILSGVLIDIEFRGDLRDLVDVFIVNVHRDEIDTPTFWTFSKRIVEFDPNIGASIFFSLKIPEEVIPFLRDDCGSVAALLTYMQHVVLGCGDAGFHCLLAGLYIDSLDAEGVKEQYDGFRKMVGKWSYKESVDSSRILGIEYLAATSSLYDADALIGKVRRKEMCLEVSAMYEHKENWKKAVEVLVHARDGVGAEGVIEKAPEGVRLGLVQGIVKLYVKPEFGYFGFGLMFRDFYARRVVELLRVKGIDALDVLPYIPNHWSLSLVSNPIITNLRAAAYGKDREVVRRSLVVGHNFRERNKWIEKTEVYGGVTMNGKVECGECGLGIQSCCFVFEGGVFRHHGECPR